MLSSVNALTSMALIFVILLSGCGHDGRVRVSGTISVDGSPVENGKIVFHPVNGERSGWGPIKKDGSYLISCLEMGDGLLPGEYQVSIVSDKNKGTRPEPSVIVSGTNQDDDGFLPVESEGRESENALRYDPTNIHIVPRKYNRLETTPLVKIIEADAAEKTIDFDLSSED